MDPKYPLYIVSKGRFESRLTSKALEKANIPYRIVIEDQEHDDYAAVIDEKKILHLDKTYQQDYDAFDNLGMTKSKGPGPARNFVWDHSISEGHAWHWVMDDNIRRFYRLNRNTKHPVGDGTIFRAMEDFVSRYVNVVMAGPQYHMFVPRKTKVPPYVPNTRIFSCNLIRNDMPYRWRGRYNEDADLSIRMLKDRWCTIQFNAFLQQKMNTQTMKGGNTDEIYAEGTYMKSKMLVDMHPDICEMRWKFGRCHHHINYRIFQRNKLQRNPDVILANQVNNYGMVLTHE